MATIETIKIFIASSSELKQDRDAFQDLLSVLNNRGHKKGVYLELVQWEHFLDTISETRKQDDYNAALKKSQIVICLFFTKAGKYTQEEFDTALRQFQETGSPLIYTYFKSGAPVPDPNNEQALDLLKFKKRLEDIQHFYSIYNNIDDLKNQFRNQLDLLEDMGFIKYQEEFRQKTKEAVANYFNAVNVKGDNNIIIQGVTADKITVIVDGKTQEIEKKLDVLQALMEQMAIKSLQSANNIYNIASITDANFGYLIGQAGHDKSLPAELAENLVGDGNGWIEGLKGELKKQGISVKEDQPLNVFQNYGWLIETFLLKMNTGPGKEKNLRGLSFMAEAYQASLRYLCYIQMAQIVQMEKITKLSIVSDFIQMEGTKFMSFDYTSLLLATTDLLGEKGFIAEIKEFVEELTNTESALYGTALYLEDQRSKLLSNSIAEDDQLPALLNEYLTALVYWLRKLHFLARYRLVSIKEINLNYHLGIPKKFVHLYAELHGNCSDGELSAGDYNSKSIKGSFNYNKSILLFKGKDVDACMDNMRDQDSYLSISPLIIDKSVYASKPSLSSENYSTQIPEIYYYTGLDKAKRSYRFAFYKNELVFSGKTNILSNKSMGVLVQNNDLPLLNELFEELEIVFKPFKNK